MWGLTYACGLKGCIDCPYWSFLRSIGLRSGGFRLLDGLVQSGRQDRDRSSGLYYVKYLNPESEAQKPSLWSRLAFWQSDAPKGQSKDYRIVVAEAKAGTEVKVLGADGTPEKSDAAARILTVLQEDLR